MAKVTKRQSRILLTGATGFVGGHIAARLLASGWSLRLLVRPSSDLNRLPQEIRRFLDAESARVELFQGDLCNPESLAEIFSPALSSPGAGTKTDARNPRPIAAVIHCACAVKGTFDESKNSRAIFEEVNVRGTRHLAKLAAAAGARMVHLSSTAAMGPVREPLVDERTKCVPAAPYQRSKRAAELALLELAQSRGLKVLILRPSLILGPGKDGGEPLQLFKLAQRGVFPMVGGAMQQTKPLVDVRDVAQACELALKRGAPGEIYLIHSDGDHSLAQIIEVARRLLGARRATLNLPEWPLRLAAHGFTALGRLHGGFNPPLTPARLDLFLADRRISIAKARQDLGFEPRHQDLYDMLGRTYIGYIRDGSLNK